MNFIWSIFFKNIYGHLLVTGYIICCIIVLQKNVHIFLSTFLHNKYYGIYVYFLSCSFTADILQKKKSKSASQSYRLENRKKKNSLFADRKAQKDSEKYEETTSSWSLKPIYDPILTIFAFALFDQILIFNVFMTSFTIKPCSEKENGISKSN